MFTVGPTTKRGHKDFLNRSPEIDLCYPCRGGVHFMDNVVVGLTQGFALG